MAEIGVWRASPRNVTIDDGDPRQVYAAEMSASGFRVASAEPLLGRALVASDEQPDAPWVAVIGHELWQTRFGSDPNVLGREVKIGHRGRHDRRRDARRLRVPGRSRVLAAVPAGRQGVNRARLSNGPGRAIVDSPSVAHLHLVRLGNNQISPIYRHQRHYWRRGAWRTFIPLSALGVALIGGTYLYADGYIPVGRQYCEGITLDGCHLNWRLVEFVDGGEDWQCVQYCPRPGVLPPPRTVTLVAPPPPPEGKCELSIYSEPNFGSVP